MSLPDLGFPNTGAGRRVHRTFGFLDLGGFTHHANVAGDDSAVAELTVFRSIVRAVGSASGVRVAKWLGDGAMLVGVETPALVSAVLEVMRRMRRADMALPLHAGVARGDVILFEGDDHIGVTVNLASRLADLAESWQVLAPSDTLQGLAGTDAVVGSLHVPGFAEPVEVADLALVSSLVEALNL